MSGITWLTAEFILSDFSKVVFADGKVVVWVGLGRFEYDNKDGKYKPCASHAIDVVRLVCGKIPKSNQQQRRIKKTKPLLRVKR